MLLWPAVAEHAVAAALTAKPAARGLSRIRALPVRRPMAGIVGLGSMQGRQGGRAATLRAQGTGWCGPGSRLGYFNAREVIVDAGEEHGVAETLR